MLVPRQPDPQRVLVVVDRHQSAREGLLRGLIGALSRLARWVASGALTADEATAQAVDAIQTTRQNVADLAWSYLDQMGEVNTSGSPRLEAPSEEVTRLARRVVTRGVSDEDVADLRKVADDSESESFGQHGRKRSDVIGYRRVVHPELSAGGTCGLCILASDVIYRRGDLRKVHDNCKCTVAEITAEYDPGDSLNNLELGDIYDEIGGTDGRQAKKVRYRLSDAGRLERYADPKQRKPEGEHAPAEAPASTSVA